MKFMPRLYAVQVHTSVEGWSDYSYHEALAPANRAAKEVASLRSRVTRVVRKSHNFEPPAPVLRDPPYASSLPDPIMEIGQDTPVEYIPGRATFSATLSNVELDPEKLRKRHQKKLARERAAVARIPTWYDRINSESEE